MKVLVGVDESVHSAAVIRYITRASWPKNAKFLVLSAATPVFGPGETGAWDAISELMQQQEKYHRSISARASARLRSAGLAAEARAVIADPRAALINAAKTKRVALVIVGSHGRTGVKKLLLGSVASHVVTHAPCSVLVVRGGRARHG
jgi:nucleotide-binding universal stress UspA family protein